MKKVISSLIVFLCVLTSVLFSSVIVGASSTTGSTTPDAVCFPFTLQYAELYYDFGYISNADDTITFSTSSDLGANIVKNWFIAIQTRITDNGNSSCYYIDSFDNVAYYFSEFNAPYPFGIETLYLRFNDFYFRDTGDLVRYFPTIASYDEECIITYDFDAIAFNSNDENFVSTHYNYRRAMSLNSSPTNYQFAELINDLNVISMSGGYIISNLVISYENLGSFAIEVPFDTYDNFSDIGMALEDLFDYDVDFGGIFDGIFNAIDGFLYAEIFPGVTLGALILVIIAIPLLIAFLRFFAGG